eukprot:IDg12960t1
MLAVHAALRCARLARKRRRRDDGSAACAFRNTQSALRPVRESGDSWRAIYEEAAKSMRELLQGALRAHRGEGVQGGVRPMARIGAQRK